MTNAEIARVLERMAVMLELDGANPFRVRAYREGARVVAAQPTAMDTMAEEPGALEALRGIGKDLAQRIRDLVAVGRTEPYEELRRKYPDAVVDFTELQGLGPKRVKTLFETLGIRDRTQLEAAAKAGKLRDLPGFGEKVEQNVLKSLANASRWAGRMLLARAWPLAYALAERVAAVPGVKHAEPAGSFRRRRETVGDLDLLACGGDPERVMAAFAEHASVAEVLGRGETKCSVRLREGLQVDLRVVPEASFGAALLYFTGSKEHNIELRKRAIERGWSLNEYGLTHGERVVASRTEEDIYRALKLAWIPPELRESHGELELAEDGRLPKLIEVEDLRGDLHMHTTRSDGRDTIDAMIEAAKARGYAYVAITEHSKALAMANGFDAARVRQSVKEIEAARKRHPRIEVFHGLEVDILADGALDLDDETLALLDWVIVSIHSRFEQSPAEATTRVLRALENPHVHAMGHPSGRLIGSREPVPFDMERVAKTAASRGVALEINASPDRLDLSDVNARLARELGCRFVIDTDAHSIAGLDQMRFGVFQARRAGIEATDVLNTLPLREFRARLARRPARKPMRPAAAKPARRKPGPGSRPRPRDRH
ncbi:MAG TPA: DNA polymerase/3'-5' exonuclease PolX [Candidatus Acidoferrales bacterium]|nr:DNA polymerase/3'-5' exonuclease PolX [Candidatus Acidoferrales bacterium]